MAHVFAVGDFVFDNDRIPWYGFIIEKDDEDPFDWIVDWLTARHYGAYCHELRPGVLTFVGPRPL